MQMPNQGALLRRNTTDNIGDYLRGRGLFSPLHAQPTSKLLQQIATAKLAARPELARELAKPDAINAITPMQSAAVTMRRRN